MRIGLRTLKTSIAIFIAISFFLVFKAIELIPEVEVGFANKWYNPFFAALAACYSLQGSKEKSISQAKNRCIASVIGGLVGILLIYIYGLCGGVWPSLPSINLLELNFLLPYILISISAILVIIIGNLLNQRQAIFVALLTFLSVTVNPGTIVPNWEFQFGINRILSTVFGVLIALLVNFIHLPHFINKKDTVSIINLDTLYNTNNTNVINYINYKLNNLKEDNITFSFFTKEAPCKFIDTIKTLNIDKPIICMNNSAIYDYNSKRYYDVKYIDINTCERINQIMHEYNITPFINKIDNNVQYIYNEHINTSLEAKYEDYVKNLPYLNYVPFAIKDNKEIVYYTIMEDSNTLEILYSLLNDKSFNDYIIVKYDNIYLNNEFIKCLRIYSKDISNNDLHYELIYNKLSYINPSIDLDMNTNDQIKVYRKYFRNIKKLYYQGDLSK